MLTKTNNQPNQKIVNLMTCKVYSHTHTHTHTQEQVSESNTENI